MRCAAIALLSLLWACDGTRERTESTNPRDVGPRTDAMTQDSGGADASGGDGSLTDGGNVPDLGLGGDGGGLIDGGGSSDGAVADSGSSGATGLEHFCQRYFVCGGTTYADVNDCVGQSLDYWGTCSTRRAALDAFSECMANLDCSEYDPNGFIPGNTPCASLWTALQNTPPC